MIIYKNVSNTSQQYVVSQLKDLKPEEIKRIHIHEVGVQYLKDTCRPLHAEYILTPKMSKIKKSYQDTIKDLEKLVEWLTIVDELAKFCDITVNVDYVFFEEIIKDRVGVIQINFDENDIFTVKGIWVNSIKSEDVCNIQRIINMLNSHIIVLQSIYNFWWGDTVVLNDIGPHVKLHIPDTKIEFR